MKEHITVGVPAYAGSAHIGSALASLQGQTHRDFEVLISVDGNDEQTADACRPFLADPRFRLFVQDQRLDWNGNVNWLLQHPLGDYFCYRQQDDTTAPEFFERLLALAHRRPDAAIVYSDCHWIGGRQDVEFAPELDGDVIARMRRFIGEKQPAPVRGLIRRAALDQAGLIRIDEFRGLSEVFVWLAKILRWGPFLRLAEPLYIRLDHAGNYHKQWQRWPERRKREAWATMFTGLLEAVHPLCSTPELRLMFELLILERIAIRRRGRSYHYDAPPNDGEGELVRECYRRLRKEGLYHLSALSPMFVQMELTEMDAEGDRLPELVAAVVSHFAGSIYRSQVPEDFKAETYLLLNRDILAARMDPYFHYVRHGMHERRRYRY